VEAPTRPDTTAPSGEDPRDRADRPGDVDPAPREVREKGICGSSCCGPSDPVAIRTHAQEPVPFVFYPAPPGLSTTPGSGTRKQTAAIPDSFVPAGTRLIEYLLA